MISIRCSMLEIARRNPAAYGQFLATGDSKTGGGSHGMFAYVQDVAKLVHTGELTTSEGVKELHNKFVRFIDNEENRTKQEKLIEQFVKYCKQYDKQNFNFVDGWRLMKWNIIPDVRLTGRTPWVVENNDGYFSYVLSEKQFDWDTELRFPLFQKYLAESTIECDIAEINVGVYSLATNTFDFKSFSHKEVSNIIKEAERIFTSVYAEYKKRGK